MTEPTEVDLDKCYELIDHYSTVPTGNRICSAVYYDDDFDDFACNALILRRMVKGLTDINLLPARVTGGSIAKSVDALVIEVGSIAIATIPDHDNCSCLIDLTNGLVRLSFEIEPYGVFEKHRVQMQERRINYRNAECSCLQKAFTNLSAAPRLSGFRDVRA